MKNKTPGYYYISSNHKPAEQLGEETKSKATIYVQCMFSHKRLEKGNYSHRTKSRQKPERFNSF